MVKPSTRPAGPLRSSRPGPWRRLIYYGLWPFEILAFGLQRLLTGLKYIIIASTPVFLAYWLYRRDRRTGGGGGREP